MKKSFITANIVALLIMSASIPVLVHAQGDASADSGTSDSSGISACQNMSSFSDVSDCGLGIIDLIIPVIIALTVLWTIYSSFELARTEGDDRKKWGFMILYGLIGIFLMISVYGLVAIFTGTFGFSGTSITVPNISSSIQQSQ